MRLTLGRARLQPRLFVLAAGLAAVAAVALPLTGGEPTQLAVPRAPAPAHPVAFYDQRTFADALLRAESAPAEPMPGVRALVIPHHWVGGHLILRGVRDLAATGEYTRVVIIGPDHVNAGSAPATTSGLAWHTPFARLEPDSTEIDKLSTAGVVRADPDVLAHEHSVAGIVHAVAYYMPRAKVMPLALRRDITYAEITALAASIAREADDYTAVIAAVDFSHGLSGPEAEANDRETLGALRQLDTARIMSFGNEHLDSPPSIALAIEFSRLLGGNGFVLRENTNSGVLGGTTSRPVTSYIEGYFTAR